VGINVIGYIDELQEYTYTWCFCVFIDEHLNWKVHIDYVYKKLLKFTGIFYKIRDVVPYACLKKLYFGFVNPHLLYGIEVYGTASITALDKLCKLNNKILRILRLVL